VNTCRSGKAQDCNILSAAFILLIVLVTGLCRSEARSRGPESRDADPRLARAVDSVLSLMTLEEKVGQLVQYAARRSADSGKAFSTPERVNMVREGRVGSFLNLVGAEATRSIQRIAVEESRMKIPLIFGLDVIHGFRTVFPIPLAEASSWDPHAVETEARIAAAEASAEGIHWTFAPMADIARDPRWGRIAEGAGEDPYLGSTMAAARVRGFQGTDVSDDNTIMACAKHFAAYGGAEGGRDYNTVDISERTLREIYLPPFHAAVEMGAGTIMSAFNEIGGIPSSANQLLLTHILRNEWGFDGFVVSDWNAVGELRAHGIASTGADAAMLALNAGVDMDMEANLYHEHLAELVREHRVSEQTLNTAVRRVLLAKFKLGLFDDPYRYCHRKDENAPPLDPDHILAAREMARKSIVLLKNEDGLLPLRKDLGTIAVIGPLADSRKDPLGPWAGVGRPEDVVTVLQGLKEAVTPGTRVIYASGCAVNSEDTSGFSEATTAAMDAHAVVLVVGESADMSGEAASRSSLGLPGVQEDLVKAVWATRTPAVVVLMNGRPLAIPWIAEQVPAIVEAWFLGVQTGNAVADVVFGDANPGGKLPVTIPRTVGQVPIYYNHKNTGRPGDEREKYTSKYLDLPLSPLYPFGYGLSYTTFSYDNLSLSSPIIGPADTLFVAIEVRNTGKRPGEEVVQLYIRDDVASVTRPVRELKRFERIHLEPGEKQRVRFALTASDLCFYDQTMRYVSEPGSFSLFVGTNSVETQTASFTLTR
jgi:beta-glucosidase